MFPSRLVSAPSCDRSARHFARERESTARVDRVMTPVDVVSSSSDTVRVLVRIRPPNAREITSGYVEAVKAHPDERALTLARGGARESVKSAPCQSFAFDDVCGQSVSQREIFERVGMDAVDGAVDGVHGCVLAYGQTGAGKTYSMQGVDGGRGGAHTMRGRGDDDGDDVVMSEDESEFAGEASTDLDDEHAGLIPRALRRLFERVEKKRAEAAANGGSCDIEVKCSYLEIYNETLRDLLMCVDHDGPAPNVREDAKRGTFVENCHEERVYGAEQTYETFLRGAANRRVGQTNMNADSSRSHSVFTISIESKTTHGETGAKTKTSALLHLVDLAGSERQKSTDAAGERLKEASAINKSLSALGNVIKALVDVADGKERHVPYRDSKLTFLLKDALGGRARCTLLACVSPAMVNVEETTSTLKFAQRAKMVKVRAVVNEESIGSANELAAEVTRLRAMLAEGGGSGGGGGASCADVAALEDIMAKANRAAAAAAKDSEEEVQKLSAKLEQTKDLCACLDKNLQSAKMIIRLRDEALKKKALTPEIVNAEIDELRKQNEHPPEVVRVRIELAELQERAERLQAENERSANRGRLATAEAELKDLRRLVVAEGELTAKALEEKALALRSTDEVEARNKELEARAEDAARRATESEKAAEAAREAQLAAEVLENEYKMAKETAEAERARVQATFEENKEIMEEMFSKLESLAAHKMQADKERAELEERLRQAEAKASNANASFEETTNALANAKAELEKAQGTIDTALATQKIEHEAVLEAKHAEFEAAMAESEASREAALATLKSQHEASLASLSRMHEASLEKAKSDVGIEFDTERAAHERALETQADELKATFAAEAASVRTAHENEIAALREQHAQALERVREEMEASKTELVDAHTSKLAAQAQAFSEQIEKINAAQAQAIAALEQRHADAMADVEARLASASEQTDNSALESAYLEKLEAVNEEHAKSMEELEGEYKAQIDTLEKALASKNDAHRVAEEALIEEHTVALEEQKSLLSTAFAADIRNAEKKLAAAREEITKAKSAASAEFSAASQAQSQIRQLQEQIEAKDDEIRTLEDRLMSGAEGDSSVEGADAHNRLDARLDSAKAARKRAEERAQDMEAKMNALNAEVEEERKSIAATKSKYSAARSRIESLEVALHAAKSELAQLKGLDPPPSVSKTPARTPAVKRSIAGRTPARTPGTMGTARRILSTVNADEPPSSPSATRPIKHMRFDSPSAGERTKPVIKRPELEGIRRGTGRLLSKPAMRVQANKPSERDA